MLVIHAYVVLSELHVDAYVPAGAPVVGQPMEESRRLGSATGPIDAFPAVSNVGILVARMLLEMDDQGIDLQAVIDV